MQGGSTKGVLPADLINTLLNIIAHAYCHNKELHALELNVCKFFDAISHHGFEDSLRFFGFTDDVICMAFLFWTRFTASVCSNYGVLEPFPINVDNIQGLKGSLFRSTLFTDMFVLWLECSGLGYMMSMLAQTQVLYEDPLDCIQLHVPGVMWVDDLLLLSDSFAKAKEMLAQYNEFLGYYHMRFNISKCKHHY